MTSPAPYFLRIRAFVVVCPESLPSRDSPWLLFLRGMLLVDPELAVSRPSALSASASSSTPYEKLMTTVTWRNWLGMILVTGANEEVLVKGRNGKLHTNDAQKRRLVPTVVTLPGTEAVALPLSTNLPAFRLNPGTGGAGAVDPASGTENTRLLKMVFESDDGPIRQPFKHGGGFP